MICVIKKIKIPVQMWIYIYQKKKRFLMQDL